MLLPNMPFVATTALWWIVSFEKTILEIKPAPGVQIMQIETGRQVWRIYNKHNIGHGSKYSSHFVTEVTEIILRNYNMLTFKPFLHLRRRRSWHSVLFSLTVVLRASSVSQLCSGVWPFLFASFGFAPISNNNSSISDKVTTYSGSVGLNVTARWRGVFPSVLTAFTSHPACKISFMVSTQGSLHKRCIMSTTSWTAFKKIGVSCHAAKCSKVFPSLVRGFKHKNLCRKSVMLAFWPLTLVCIIKRQRAQ